MRKATTRSPSFQNSIVLYMALVCSLFSIGTTPAPAQLPLFDYKGDSERIPAEISLDLEAGKYEIVPSEYLSLEHNLSGSLVNMQGFTATTSPGDPILPVHTYEIALPPNIDWQTVELSVDSQETTTLPGTYELLPAPPERARVEQEELVNWGKERTSWPVGT